MKHQRFMSGIAAAFLALHLLSAAGCRFGVSQVPESSAIQESLSGSTACIPVSTVPDVSEATSASTAAPPEIQPDDPPVVSGITPLGKSAYYGRRTLAGMERADALLAAYDRIAAGVEKGEAVISLKDSQRPVTGEELKLAAEYYRRDYPQHFWYKGSYTYQYAGETVVSVTPDYTMTGPALARAREEFDAAVRRALSPLSPSDNDYQRELHLHDWLAEKSTYQEAANAHNAYGALVEGQAVCEGYARAFQYLLYQAGIQCLYVTGQSVNPGGETSAPEGHGWNIVRIDGAYYHVDLTWNDQEEHLFHAYFNLTDTRIWEDHQPDDENYPLPACTAQTADYFIRNDLVASPLTAERVAGLLDRGALTGGFYVEDPKGFWPWAQENIRAIARALGISGEYTYGCSSIGHQIIFYIQPN